jgi:hypothetical protein
VTATREQQIKQLLVILNKLVDVNLAILLSRPIVEMVNSGVHYQPKIGETLCSIDRILEQGHADADELVAWRVAELRKQGIAAKVYIKIQEHSSGATLLYPMVKLPDESFED